MPKAPKRKDHMMTGAERKAAVALSQVLGNAVTGLRALGVTPDAVRDFMTVALHTYAEAEDRLYKERVTALLPITPQREAKADIYGD